MMHSVNTPPRVDQLVRERLALDADADPLRVERHLRRPVERHAVAALALVGRADDVEPRRHLPQHAPPEPVVLVGIGAVGKRRNRTIGRRHGPRLRAASLRAVTREGQPCQLRQGSSLRMDFTFAHVLRIAVVEGTGEPDTDAAPEVAAPPKIVVRTKREIACMNVSRYFVTRMSQ